MSMNAILARTCDLPVETVEAVLLAYSQYAAVHMAFNGPLKTPLGMMGMQGGEVFVFQQNEDFLRLTQGGFDSEEFLARVTQIIVETKAG